MSNLTEWVNATPERQRAFAEEGLIALVAEQLHATMESQGVTKVDLAKRLGCSKAHVTGLLSGSRNMTCRTLAHIAHVLGVKLTVSLESPAQETRASDSVPMGAPGSTADSWTCSCGHTNWYLGQCGRQGCGRSRYVSG